MESAVDKVFTAEEKAKLDMLFRDGVTVLREVDDLSVGLAETIKAIGEELQVKPGVLKKALKTAYKDDFQHHSDDHEMLETLLATVGKI